MNKEEQNYLDLMKHILETGSDRDDRTGVGTRAVFGTQLRFSLEDNTFPLLTTKKVFVRGIIEELLFFIRGDTDTKKLESKGINIWKGNTSREFLDKRGLTHLAEGDMGKGYGFQWRNFGGGVNRGVDQLQDVFNALTQDPFSRRHIVTAWNPNQLSDMSLPPCHMQYQFFVDKGTLSCQWYQRSVDCGSGLPFNIASYALLTHLFAKATGLKAKEVIFTGGDTHIYSNHFDGMREQISRTPFEFPKINIKKEISSLQDIENLSYDDFEVVNYISHPAIKFPMAV